MHPLPPRSSGGFLHDEPLGVPMTGQRPAVQLGLPDRDQQAIAGHAGVRRLHRIERARGALLTE